ncbi:hypothetical protein BDZ91DRAFT_759301 [Kalaharituber pfeilii]|nr:hypothetical protein BDZ91DRAFT_759301 [Kalaharituber pfeilii]
MPLIPTISGLRILSSTKNFTVRYSVTGQVLALFHFINNPFNPIRNKLLAKYKRQEQEFVLIVNTTKKSLSTKACVRVNIARRIRELVLAELREQGWGRDGSVIGPKTPKGVGIPQDGGFPRYPLKGCLAFFPYEESVTTPVEVLRKEVKQGVERFLTKHEEARIAALELQLLKAQARAGETIFLLKEGEVEETMIMARYQTQRATSWIDAVIVVIEGGARMAVLVASSRAMYGVKVSRGVKASPNAPISVMVQVDIAVQCPLEELLTINLVTNVAMIMEEATINEGIPGLRLVSIIPQREI